MRTRDKDESMSDNINHPKHYQGKYEVWDVLDEWFPNNPTLWNCGKYLARADRKGAPLEDLKKARVYLEREIEKREAAAHVGGVAIPVFKESPSPPVCQCCLGFGEITTEVGTNPCPERAGTGVLA